MRKRKILGTQLIMALVAIIIGLKMKIEHADYAQLVILLGFSAVLILYPFRFWNKPQKSIVDYVRLITIISCALKGLAIGSRTLEKSWYGDASLMLAKAMLVIWLLVELFYSFRKK